MGKRHSTSLKLRHIGNWNNISYNNNNINKEKIIKFILNSYFIEKAIISEPIFIYKLNEIKIIIYYWSSFNLLLDKDINKILLYINNILNIKVNINIIKLKKPYLSSKILSEYISINIKKYNIKKIAKKIIKQIKIEKKLLNPLINFNYNNIKYYYINKKLYSSISGIKLVFKGRLSKRRTAERKKILTFNKGFLNKNSLFTLIDYKSPYNFKFINGSIGIKTILNNTIHFI
uniref:Small ribosomal subunit protein uS3m n=1 Tax=Zancudomyces culisetae TaxID=1213189 RepID=Q3T4C4_ZANCU|nr:ribosomal protein S3 [Zancudomyces culisetae]AAW49490.1 ribosomal protein S3 [Zancudomyces culisetae]